MCCCLCAAVLLQQMLDVQHSAAARVKTHVVTITDNVDPEVNGGFFELGGPALNDRGVVVFLNYLYTTREDVGLFHGNSNGDPVPIVLEGESAPDGNGAFSYLDYPALNNADQTAFVGLLSDTIGGDDYSFGLFRSSGTSSPERVVREGDTAPDGNGTFSTFGFPALNLTGQTAFQGFLSDTINGENEGIFRSDNSSIVQFARVGQLAPDGNGSFSRFDHPLLNNAGQVAFRGDLIGTTFGSNDDSGIFLSNDKGSLVQIAREGSKGPDGNGTFSRFLTHFALNDIGQVAFNSILTDTNGGSDAQVLFLSDGTGGLVRITSEGDPAPDSNGNFSGTAHPVLNNVGQVAFVGKLTGTRGGRNDSGGVFRGDGMNNLVQIARTGQASPDSNGNFFLFFTPSLNDRGQAAFIGILGNTIADDGSDDLALYFHDDHLGLTQLVRTGDALLGSTITSLIFGSGVTSTSNERSGLNELGQVAYRFFLADGRQGIAIATVVPEPTTFVLVLSAISALLLRHRSIRPV